MSSISLAIDVVSLSHTPYNDQPNYKKVVAGIMFDVMYRSKLAADTFNDGNQPTHGNMIALAKCAWTPSAIISIIVRNDVRGGGMALQLRYT